MTLALLCIVFLGGERQPDDCGVRYEGRTIGHLRITIPREVREP
jgi:hypothetical protein